jgi:hypothetical protein
MNDAGYEMTWQMDSLSRVGNGKQLFVPRVRAETADGCKHTEPHEQPERAVIQQLRRRKHAHFSLPSV